MQLKNSNHTSALTLLYRDLFKHEPSLITPLPVSGSNRLYFRLEGAGESIIGAFNDDVNENKTFLTLTQHFATKGLNVPKLLSVSNDLQYYLLSDLGDKTLYSSLVCHIRNGEYDETMMGYFRQSLSQLVRFQTEGSEGLDFSCCYPKQLFDRRSVMWDLNYFKYSFLKPFGVIFDEDKLENEFTSFANYLLDDDMNYFLYRDFQSRNIMVKGDELYFIDYQGGRKGPCLYDVASFLYQAKAAIPQHQRDTLFEFYLEKLTSKRDVNIDLLKERYPAFILFRIIQTLGAYGYRGYFEGKAHFLLSIPPAIENLRQVLSSNLKSLNIDYLLSILESLITKAKIKFEQTEPFEGLTIEITSFSLKNGYPTVNPEHGGGFIFDCRFLPNPGRLAKFKDFTGIDKPVVEYLNEKPEANVFMNSTFELVQNAVNNYIERGFSYLSVGYGCTGGQHRSVYCANKLAQMLNGTEGVRIILKHREISDGK